GERRAALITHTVTKGLDPTAPLKDSGIPWLGLVPAHWEVVRLKWVAEVVMGQSPPSETYNENGYGVPFLQGNADFGAQSPAAGTWCTNPSKLCKAGDLLLSVRAPVGALNKADIQYGIGRGLCAIRPADAALPEHFWYHLMVSRAQLETQSDGSTYDAVSTSDVGALLIALPPLPEQRAIAAYLDDETARLDGLVERAQRMITLLEEYRAALITAAVTGQINVT
ncbi:MAG: restriction endonuclease subunit S, partial [Anaerolineae bacterium]